MEKLTIRISGSINGMTMFEMLSGSTYVGSFTLDFNQSNEFEFDNFFVKSEFRGNGFGKSALNYSWENAVQKGTDLVLNVNSKNERAQAIYSKFGFQFTGESQMKSESLMLKMVKSV